MTLAAAAPTRTELRLWLARAAAWLLLLSGWIGVGSFALVLAPSLAAGFALVALWLLALGAAATVATRDTLPAPLRRLALAACSIAAALALLSAPRGGALAALVVALLAWAALTALASGVVRGLRLGRRAPPGPPIGAASGGALATALLLGDIGDLQALAPRLAALAVGAALLLMALQPRDEAGASPASRCRAGLFDCSLPAWPRGAWSEPQQWPTLLAGLAMLPMMAALPLMVAWCRTQSVPPQALLALHLLAMFAPALLLRRVVVRWSMTTLSAACASCLAAGAAAAWWADPPWQLLGVAMAHGAAWSLAWAGQLWAPDRRSRQGASPLRAALGYAVLTSAFGLLVDRLGEPGVAAAHVALGLVALAAWAVSAVAKAAAPAASARRHEPPAAHPDHRAGGR